MPTRYQQLIVAGMAIATLALIPQAWGQNPIYWDVADGDYNTPSNWDLDFVPDTEFDAAAIITNGGTARLTGPAIANPAQVILGEAAGESGTLVIGNGGSLDVRYFDNPNTFTPSINVGIGGVGTLDAQAGSSLSGGSLVLGGPGGSSAMFAGTNTTPSTISIGFHPSDPNQVGTVLGEGTTLGVKGPGVDFRSLSYSMAGSATFVAGLTGPSHSAIKVPNPVNLGGTLRVEIDPLANPQGGDAWNLFDATDINGSFANIEVIGGPSLGVGQTFSFQEVEAPGTSENGVFGQLRLEQQLVLVVNRDTNQMSIVNGSGSVAIDGYAVTSALGGINPGNWSSFQDTVGNQWRESPQNGTINALAELKSVGTQSITAGSPINLGAVFDLPAPPQRQVELEDIQFEYYQPDGTVVQAAVVYEGEKRYNDLVLVVDPVDGDVMLQNQSTLSVSIEGYTVHSDSNSLKPASWMSLDDQSASDGTWRESGITATEISNNSADDVSELQSGAVTLMSGGRAFDLGDLFKTAGTGGTEDLEFGYLVAGDDAFTTGVVVYREFEFPQGVTGDYNGDGVVNLADYTVWRNTLGASVPAGTGADGNGDGTVNVADYQEWKTNFGMSSASAAASVTAANVPEPSGVMAIVLTVALLGFGKRSFER